MNFLVYIEIMKTTTQKIREKELYSILFHIYKSTDMSDNKQLIEYIKNYNQRLMCHLHRYEHFNDVYKAIHDSLCVKNVVNKTKKEKSHSYVYI